MITARKVLDRTTDIKFTAVFLNLLTMVYISLH